MKQEREYKDNENREIIKYGVPRLPEVQLQLSVEIPSEC
jgi:hypothetical protein